jgi:hypothetical protein
MVEGAFAFCALPRGRLARHGQAVCVIATPFSSTTILRMQHAIRRAQAKESFDGLPMIHVITEETWSTPNGPIESERVGPPRLVGPQT